MTDFAAAREAMVDCQIRPSDVTKYPIIDAFLRVPREHYVPANKAAIAYAGEHISLGGERVVLDPRSFAKMLDAANITKEDLVLDLGCGTGYSSAIIAHMAQAVVAVEDNPELANEAAETLAKEEVFNAIVVNALLSQGAVKHGPYDVIIVQGAVEVLSKKLLDQLSDGGRVVAIFREGPLGQCRIGTKSSGTITWRNLFEADAPLLGEFQKNEEFTFA